MIDVSKIGYKYPQMELYYQDQKIAVIKNEIEMYQVFLMVAEANSSEYSLHLKDNKYKILPSGTLDKWPNEPFSQVQRLFAKIIEIRRARLKNQDEHHVH